MVERFLTRHPVSGDGNCLFRSIGVFTVGEANHLEVRRAVLDEVTVNRLDYVPFCPDIEAWKEGMTKPGHWGDGVAVRAASNSFRRPIVVFRSETHQEPSIFVPPGSLETRELFPMYLLLDETSAGAEHYDPLLPPKDWVPFASEGEHSLSDDSAMTTSAMPDLVPIDEDGIDDLGDGDALGGDEIDKDDTDCGDEHVAAPDVVGPIVIAEPKKDVSSETKEKRKPALRRSRKKPIHGDGEAAVRPAKKKPQAGLRARKKAKLDLPTRGDEEAVVEPTKKKAKLRKKPTSAVKPDSEKPVPTSDGKDAGHFAIGLSSELAFSPRCVKCKEIVVRSKMRCVGKQKTVWICKVCHSRSTQLYKAFGSWPPKHFKELSENEQTEFYLSIKKISSAKMLKQFTEDKISTGKEEYFRAENRGAYLPLSVWKKKGFNTKRIKLSCKDVRMHPVLGKTYCLDIHERVDGVSEFYRRSKDHVVSDRAPDVVPARLSPSQKMTAEERQQCREEVRASKAVATQAAREEKKKKKLAQTCLRKVVNASFNLSQVISSKAFRKLDEICKTRALEIKRSLTVLEKHCQDVVLGKAKALSKEVDSDACNSLCEQACQWHEIVVSNLSKMACKVK